MRTCGDCTLCCQVLDIPELAKPAGRLCVHANAGCTIYPDRPKPCRTFTCGWLATPGLGEAWRPDIAGFLVRDERDQGYLCIDVDPARPEAWRAQPYLAQIKAWSWMVHDRTGCLLVYTGREVTVVFPEADIALGPVGPDPRLSIGYLKGADGRRPFVRLLDGDRMIREWLGQSGDAKVGR